MGESRYYTPEFKIHVVNELLLPENKHNNKLIAEKYGINPSTVTKWRQQYEKYGEAAFDQKARKEIEKNRVRDLEKRVADLEEENEILKKAAAFLADVGRK